jgi:flavin-dependent dehydrogenase
MNTVITDQIKAAQCDVLVIGSGPGGSTISALLAERGRNVVLIEKSRHPRFHIGESLLPLNMPLFEKLGIAEEIERIGMPKYGVEFISPYHPRPTTFNFADAWDKSFPSAYQVRRSAFDHILFRNAANKGATAIEECRVIDVEFHAKGALVTGQHADGREQKWQTNFVVDASGRDTFLAKKFNIKLRNDKHNSAAIFGHFSGAARLPGKDEGNITVFWFAHGWFWFIPLSDGSTSVGAVCWPAYMKSRTNNPEEFFFDTSALCPPLKERLRDAMLLAPVTATGNYSYQAKRTGGINYLMLGDAFAFIDPVFSSGVFIAMHSAFVGADAIETCLDNPQRAAIALKTYDKAMRRGPKVFSWFIYRVTTPILRNMFMDPHNRFRLQEAVLSVLAGDIFRGTPLGLRLFLFKTLYHLKNITNFKNSWGAWEKRKRAMKSPDGDVPSI